MKRRATDGERLRFDDTVHIVGKLDFGREKYAFYRIEDWECNSAGTDEDEASGLDLLGFFREPATGELRLFRGSVPTDGLPPILPGPFDAPIITTSIFHGLSNQYPEYDFPAE